MNAKVIFALGLFFIALAVATFVIVRWASETNDDHRQFVTRCSRSGGHVYHSLDATLCLSRAGSVIEVEP